MVEMALMKKYQFIEVNELQSRIKYDSVEFKRKRPCMIYCSKN